MKKGLVFGVISGAMLLSACGGSPKVPEQAIQTSGIISSQRNGNAAVILYQEKRTRPAELSAEANRMCGIIGKSAGSYRTAEPKSKIPGVDAKVIYQCI